jgi:CRISPR/Cas system-associated protein Csm6
VLHARVLQVLLQVARLADAELMPAILDSTAAALQSSSIDAVLTAVKDAPEQVCAGLDCQVMMCSTSEHVLYVSDDPTVQPLPIWHACNLPA